jgi:uncharacterized repeat protein (TIGR03803 family)
MPSRKSILVQIATLTILVAALAGSARAAGNERVLFSFSGGTDGGQPLCDLVFDAHGNLYGTTSMGGAFGDGTVFELTPAANGLWSEWTGSVLHSFHSDGRDGANPSAGVVFDEAGNLWGTTENGGTDNFGTVFKLSPSPNGTWSETVLSLSQANPASSLIFDKAGNVYGTTRRDSPASGTGSGTVFKLAPASHGAWTRTTLYGFATESPYVKSAFDDGAGPRAGVIFDAAGNLYGTTQLGGRGTSDGTVFKLTRRSNGTWAEAVLHSFDSSTGDGGRPAAALILDAQGNVYGTAVIGGADKEGGVVFELAPGPHGQWSEKILYNFNDKNDTTGNGWGPHCRLVFDKAGNLYGTTGMGGHGLGGTVFKLSPGPNGTWSMTVLHAFARDHTEGNGPQAGLIFDAQGNLFGTMERGGGDPNDLGHGVVFEILAGSGPAVSSEVQPVPVPAPAAPTPVSPGPSSPAAPQGNDPLAAVWQSDALAAQTFHFRLNGNAIDVYGGQQELLGTLEAKEKKGAIDVYQGLVQIGPLMQCPGGHGLMQIRIWNESQLDARIETPLNAGGAITCGGVMGTGRLVRWQQVTFVKK